MWPDEPRDCPEDAPPDWEPLPELWIGAPTSDDARRVMWLTGEEEE